MPEHYPVKLSPYLAYIAYMQIAEIEEINRKKDKLCRAFYDTFNGIHGVKQYYSDGYNFVRYPLLFDKSVSEDRIKRVKDEMKKAGIVSGEWFNDVVHPKGSLRYCYVDGSCPVGESVTTRMINLPVNIHRQLNNKDLKKLRDIFARNLKE
jgi:dTDP-4-amino-4,6-dideoxygalactose transaminase